MNIFIIASDINYILAKKLLKNIGGVSVYRTKYCIAEKKFSKVNRDIEDADVILVMLDEKFEEDVILNKQLQYALDCVSIIEEQKIITVALNNTKVPDCLTYHGVIFCRTMAGADIISTNERLKKIIKDLNYESKLKNRRFRKSREIDIISITLAIEAFAISYMLFGTDIFTVGGNIYYERYLMIFLELLIVGVSILALITSYVLILKKKRRDNNINEMETYSYRLKKAFFYNKKNSSEEKGSINENNQIDALGRMMINLEDIKEFYTWSQKQAKAAFTLAVTMCILGFLLLLFPFILSLLKYSIEASIIITVGGVITELIAGTALVVYRCSLTQINHYHKALHEDERFLSSINLIEKINNAEEQNEMYKEIIRSEIQMSILEMTDGMKKEKD